MKPIAARAFLRLAFREGWQVAQPISVDPGYDYVFRRVGYEPWQTVRVEMAYLATARARPGRVVDIRPRGCGADFLFVWDGDAYTWLIPMQDLRRSRSPLLLMTSKGLSRRWAQYACEGLV